MPHACRSTKGQHTTGREDRPYVGAPALSAFPRLLEPAQVGRRSSPRAKLRVLRSQLSSGVRLQSVGDAVAVQRLHLKGTVEPRLKLASQQVTRTLRFPLNQLAHFKRREAWVSRLPAALSLHRHQWHADTVVLLLQQEIRRGVPKLGVAGPVVSRHGLRKM